MENKDVNMKIKVEKQLRKELYNNMLSESDKVVSRIARARIGYEGFIDDFAEYYVKEQFKSYFVPGSSVIPKNDCAVLIKLKNPLNVFYKEYQKQGKTQNIDDLNYLKIIKSVVEHEKTRQKKTEVR